MMNGFELGGCCLARIGSTTPYFPSKTEQIMSKYRPIAPKPLLQTQPSPAAAAPPKICASGAVPSPPARGCGRGSRKRSAEAASAPALSQSPRSTKRASRSRAAAAAAAAPASQSLSTSHNQRQRQSDASEDTASTICELSPDSAASNGNGNGGGGFAAFMERAASNAKNAESGEPVTLALLPPRGSGASETSALEKAYGAAAEPVVAVTNQSRHIVWCNAAYRRLASGYAAPELYGLLPKAVAVAGLSLPGGVAATVWGFVRVGVAGKPKCEGEGGGGGGVGVGAPVVITPQPLRAVGSTITVEGITGPAAAPAPESGVVEAVEEQLEREAAPAVVTDAGLRARWANSAYRQMVGQPRCAWLAPHVTRLNGDVAVVLKAPLPAGADAFSCRVKIQWNASASASASASSGNERTSMTVPCDVFRFGCGGADVFLAWRFDVQAALSL